jgi:hypothetical protein
LVGWFAEIWSKRWPNLRIPEMFHLPWFRGRGSQALGNEIVRMNLSFIHPQWGVLKNVSFNNTLRTKLLREYQHP